MLCYIDVGKFPDMSEKLKFFQSAFDHSKARKEGVIIPYKGVNQEYDQALQDIELVKQELENYLQKQRKRLGCKVCCVGVVNYN